MNPGLCVNRTSHHRPNGQPCNTAALCTSARVFFYYYYYWRGGLFVIRGVTTTIQVFMRITQLAPAPLGRTRVHPLKICCCSGARLKSSLPLNAVCAHWSPLGEVDRAEGETRASSTIIDRCRAFLRTHAAATHPHSTARCSASLPISAQMRNCHRARVCVEEEEEVEEGGSLPIDL